MATISDPRAVRAQVLRIVATEPFRRSERLGRFLEHIVERALAGHPEQITEYALAVEVLGRKSSFDPREDPIVRVEAGRLRGKLAAYYSTVGRDDPIVIELPPRTYVPVFRERTPAGPQGHARALSGRKFVFFALLAFAILAAAAGSVYWAVRQPPDRPAAALSLIVLPFADLSAGKDLEYFSDGLTDELIEALAHLEGVRVVSRTSSFHFKASPRISAGSAGISRPAWPWKAASGGRKTAFEFWRS